MAQITQPFMMDKPNFTSIIYHARVREAQLIGPQAVPHTQRLYKCECCNDSGIVQAWKLNRWAKNVLDVDLDPVMSLPVLCNRLSTCGEVEIQVFADKDKDENAQRTRRQNFKECENIGKYIRDEKLKALSTQQSDYIHHKILEYRELLSVTDKGKAYVDAVRKAAREAVASKPSTRLSHIGEVLATFEMPPEPDYDVELDGVTTPTNNHPIPNDLPF